ncbi:hypothetical protein MTR_8g044170 [Medicago truncatula]|uniref:Uncharacterized protein n=1 Tax=Medicago truncatula TaxID=3880 RepID=G7L709_MEDTR|nr:hypothetical protein MTR_8g044170 [Medicago truncatula]
MWSDKGVKGTVPRIMLIREHNVDLVVGLRKLRSRVIKGSRALSLTHNITLMIWDEDRMEYYYKELSISSARGTNGAKASSLGRHPESKKDAVSTTISLD